MADVVYAGDAGVFKACSKCGEIKPSGGFYRHKRGGFACLSGSCRNCTRASVSIYNEAHRDEQRVKAAIRREKNPNYYIDNKEAFGERSRRWKAKNPERHRAIGRKAYKKRQSTLKGRLDHAVSSGVYASLKGNKSGRSTYEILGYSLEDLIRHLESQFTEGMSWDNYGEWHVDHEIPKSIFNYVSPDHIDFKRAWALRNLRPLWSDENHRKHAKYDAPFQPSLAI